MASLGAWDWLVNKASQGIEAASDAAKSVKGDFNAAQSAAASRPQTPSTPTQPAPAGNTLHAASDTPRNAMAEADRESQ